MAYEEELVLLRNSERAAYRRCRQKWWWSYVELFSVKREKGALAFGTMVHKALEVYYPPGRKRGVHPAKTFAKLYDIHKGDFNQWDEEGNKIPARELGIGMLEGYVDLYGKDDHIKIIQPELPIQIDVCDKFGNYICTWVGKSDAAYEDLSKSTKSHPVLGLFEHKTAKSIDEELGIVTGYGEQGLSYWWAGDNHFHHEGLLPEGVHLDHVRFNWLRKGLPTDKARNARGHVLNKPTKAALANKLDELGGDSTKKTIQTLTEELEKLGVDTAMLGEPAKRQPRPLFWRYDLNFHPGQLDSINRRIRAEAWEMDQVKQGNLPVYKSPSMDCKWGCQFYDVCEIHELGGDYESVLELEFEKWNPYSDHELDEEKS